MTAAGRPPRGDAPTVFMVAGEESGDALGAALMKSLTRHLERVRFVGVGGDRMAALGLSSLFPIARIQLHGLAEVLVRLPELLQRVRSTADAVLDANPDVLVLVDAPAFNLRVARLVRRHNPQIPIVDYVSPTVWAWGPWRSWRMRPLVDHLMAILPFEPDVHRQLGGPPTTYVGHPLIERLDVLRSRAGERTALEQGVPPVLLVLPGSRRSEVSRLTALFGETVALVAKRFGPVEAVLPAVPSFADEIRRRVARWPVRPQVVTGEDAKFAAFRRAHAALAASGTVTLELALAEVPMVVAYRVDLFLRALKPLLRAKSIVLANLIAGENAIPEFLDSHATPARLAEALVPLLSDTPQRARQLAAFKAIARRLDDGSPSERAAEIVLGAMRRIGGSA